MSSRPAKEAVAAFVASLQAAVSCISESAHLVSLGYSKEVDAIALGLVGGDPLALDPQFPVWSRRGDNRLDLTLVLYYKLDIQPDGSCVVQIAEYSYGLELPGNPPLPVIRYDWHPHVDPSMGPHMHVSANRAEDGVINHKTHLVTGFITLIDVLAYVVREHKVLIRHHHRALGVRRIRPGAAGPDRARGRE